MPGAAFSIDADIDMPLFDEELEPPPREETPPPTPPPADTGRGARAKRPTWKLLQQLPPPPPEFLELAPEPEEEESDSEFPEAPLASSYTWQSIKTIKNSFGLFRMAQLSKPGAKCLFGPIFQPSSQ